MIGRCPILAGLTALGCHLASAIFGASDTVAEPSPSRLAPTLAPAPRKDRIIAVDLSAIDETTFRAIDGAKLEKEIIARLVRFGFLVGRLDESPEGIVAVHKDDQGFSLQVRCAPARERIAAAVQVRWGATRDQAAKTALHYEIAAKATELTSTYCLAAVVEPPGPPAAPLATPQPMAAQPSSQLPSQSPSLARQPLVFRLGLGFATATRKEALYDDEFNYGTDIGALIAVGITTDQWEIYGKGSTLFADTEDLRAAEFALQLGVARALVRRGRWLLQLGLEGGVLIHHYNISRDAPARSGTLYDGLVGVPVQGCAELRRGWRLCGTLSAARTFSAARAHYVGDTPIWYRGGFRVGMDMLAQVSL